ncbi:hypothetical protein F5888DRAFT_1732661 [Russula emetica]|nr:hypothetical protein F5888DRAFT_1732661 [Russula emetica]
MILFYFGLLVLHVAIIAVKINKCHGLLLGEGSLRNGCGIAESFNIDVHGVNGISDTNGVTSSHLHPFLNMIVGSSALHVVRVCITFSFPKYLVSFFPDVVPAIHQI